MADNIYMPPKPNNPYLSTNDGPDPCFKPTDGRYPPGPSCGCGPMPNPPYPPTPPPPGPRPDPHCVPWSPPPCLDQVPPVPSVLEGQSLYESMNILANRVNVCISQWNAISRNCFEAMNACVQAARANDVYYDDCEVKYFTGYSEDDGCAYAMVQKEAVDRNCQPIFVKLALAYDNTTNAGIKQDIFDVSFIKSANMMITAVPPSQTAWRGPAMYQGSAIPGTIPAEEIKYSVYGFNRNGALRVFDRTVTQQDLCQNAMVDVIGGCIPILIDGEITDQAKTTSANRGSIQAIGYNNSNGRVYFFSCSSEDQKGMYATTVAKILQGYGCVTAVISSFIPVNKQDESAGMLYMGQMTTVPDDGRSPENLAYWYISKQPCFRNRFQKEVADLVQTTGQNAWKNYLLGVQIQSFDDRILQNYQAIQDEIKRAMAAESDLQYNINSEVDRAEEAERLLQENINKEVKRATDAETALDEKIKAETARATAAEQALDQKIIDETARAKAAENANAAAIAAEKLRAQTRENEIQDALDKEIRERISADNDIINALEQEVLARRAADTEIHNKIDATKNELNISISQLQTTINGMIGGQTELPYLKLTGGTLTGPVTFSENNTITLGRGPTEEMEAATKKYVDDQITGGTTPGGDVSKEYVDQQIAAVQTQVTGKVNKAGDSMTGTLNMGANKIENPVLSSNTGIPLDNGAGGPGTITQVADPTTDDQVANKHYVDQAVQDIGVTDFVQKTGDEMTGDLNMLGDAGINFYDTAAVAALMSMDATTPTGRLTSTAKKLGLTKELLQLAKDKGLDTDTATIKDVVDATGAKAGPIAGQTLVGSVNNDGTDLVVKSENGGVDLRGTEVAITNGKGAPAPLYIGDVNLYVHNQGTSPQHLDLNVPTDEGAVYINRSSGGQVVSGGTGALHVTSIVSPNELDLNPGTSVDVNGKAIKGVSKIRSASGTAIDIHSSPTSTSPDGNINLKNIQFYRQGTLIGSLNSKNPNIILSGATALNLSSPIVNLNSMQNSIISANNNPIKNLKNAELHSQYDAVNSLTMAKYGVGSAFSKSFEYGVNTPKYFTLHTSTDVSFVEVANNTWYVTCQPPKSGFIRYSIFFILGRRNQGFTNTYIGTAEFREDKLTDYTSFGCKSTTSDNSQGVTIGYINDGIVAHYGIKVQSNSNAESQLKLFYTWYYNEDQT